MLNSTQVESEVGVELGNNKLELSSANAKLNFELGWQAGVHKTGIRGIQDTRQIVDGKTNDIENNNKKGGSKPLS